MLRHSHPEYVSCACGYNAVNHARKPTIFLLLPRLFLLSPSPSPSGTLWTRSRLPRAYLSKMAESALAARAKIRPPCTLKHRVQQEYNSLLVNALNRIFKSNLSLNNFKWLLTKLKLSCIRNIIPRSTKRLWNGYLVLNQELQTHDPVGRHIPVYGNVWEYLIPPRELTVYVQPVQQAAVTSSLLTCGKPSTVAPRVTPAFSVRQI